MLLILTDPHSPGAKVSGEVGGTEERKRAERESNYPHQHRTRHKGRQNISLWKQKAKEDFSKWMSARSADKQKVISFAFLAESWHWLPLQASSSIIDSCLTPGPTFLGDSYTNNWAKGRRRWMCSSLVSSKDDNTGISTPEHPEVKCTKTCYQAQGLNFVFNESYTSHFLKGVCALPRVCCPQICNSKSTSQVVSASHKVQSQILKSKWLAS